MKIAGKTDIGKSRTENQDNFRSGRLTPDVGWGIVCDGMGGAKHGRLASTVAVESLEEQFYRSLTPAMSNEEIKALIMDGMHLANAEVYARSGNGQQVMGTTAVCAVVVNGKLYMAHVGDSRAYLYEGGELKQLTRDHSMVQELVDQGVLTPEQAKRHPERNVITRALGVDSEVEADYQERELWPGSILLLCTDGLSSLVSNERIEKILKNNELNEIPTELVNEALLAGGHDNITVLIIEMGKGVAVVG